MRAALLCIALLSGCAGADLRPDTLRGGIDAESRARGESLLAQSADALGVEAFEASRCLEWELEDHWSSAWLRSLTPLSDDRQRMRVRVRRREDGEVATIELRFLSGSMSGHFRQIEDGVALMPRGGEMVREGDSLLELYAESLVLYLVLPLLRGGDVASAGERSLKGERYDLVYRSPPADGPREQYLLWFGPGQTRPAIIEFTYRELYAGYRGALAYADWRQVYGMSLPFFIRVLDAPGAAEATHEIRVRQVRRCG